GMTNSRATVNTFSQRSSLVYRTVNMSQSDGTVRMPIFSMRSQSFFSSKEGERVIIAYPKLQTASMMSVRVRARNPGTVARRAKNAATANAATAFSNNIKMKMIHSKDKENHPA